MRFTRLALTFTIMLAGLAPCRAQDVAPVIYLTPAETVKAKRLAQNAKDADARQRLTRMAWRNFNNSYQASHPELPHLRFTSDFKLALGETQSYPVDEVIAATLSTAERQKAETLFQAMKDADTAEPKAERAWVLYQYDLVAAHVLIKGTETIGLSDGTQVRVAPGWVAGLAFTPDFRVAVPKHP
ncbi:MAG TPA: hypothetical protein VGX94_06095 [Terriglobia bacterium]|nr:hypothetical protein [Terriglobia bacterium]